MAWPQTFRVGAACYAAPPKPMPNELLEALNDLVVQRLQNAVQPKIDPLAFARPSAARPGKDN